ncbi:MAG TPA: hypothetical protein VGS09_01545 [Actinomycetota bacterium]|jgi:hypothetical protein|nr:hypothetical protein [Actinomycetota bacterium]
MNSAEEPVWFPYDVGPESPRVAFRDEALMRPLLDVWIESSFGDPVHTRLLVDSGSEYTLVTRAFARRLGIADRLSLDYAEEIQIGGMSLMAELCGVQLVIPSLEPYEATVGFVANWEVFAHSGVLGQRGFFDHVGVVFDRANLRFGLTSQGFMDSRFGVPLAPEPKPPPRMWGRY